MEAVILWLAIIAIRVILAWSAEIGNPSTAGSDYGAELCCMHAPTVFVHNQGRPFLIAYAREKVFAN